MTILNNGRKSEPEIPTLELVKYRVIGKPYSQWRVIFAQLGQSDTEFLMCLREQGIYIDKDEDPILYCTEDTHQLRILAEQGVTQPTDLQLLLSTKAFGLTKEDAAERIEKVLREASGDVELS